MASPIGVLPATSSKVIPTAGVSKSARSTAATSSAAPPTAGTYGKPDHPGAGFVGQPPRPQNRPGQASARGEVGIGRALGLQ